MDVKITMTASLFVCVPLDIHVISVPAKNVYVYKVTSFFSHLLFLIFSVLLWNTNTHAFSLVFRPEMFETHHPIKESTSSSRALLVSILLQKTLSETYFAAAVLNIIARVAVEIKPGKYIQNWGCV